MIYEMTCDITVSVHVHASTEAEARAHVSTWEDSWLSHGSFVGASDLSVVSVRDGEPAEADTEAVAAWRAF